MNRRFSYSAILLFLVFSLAGAQVTQRNQPPVDKQTSTLKDGQTSAKSKDDVVRISVTLVQIDAVVLDRQGKQVTDQINRTYTVRVKEDAYQELQLGGLVYTLNLPIKKPGAYQLRAAVRDATTERAGSAGEFVEVPDLAKGRLSISGIVLQGRDPNVASSVAKEPSTSGQQQKETDPGDPQANPAVRRFKPGLELEYNFLIFNAQLGKATRSPQLETQMLLFRDGQRWSRGRSRHLIPANRKI